MQNIKNLDRYRGCLVGGAAGDALGYVFLITTQLKRSEIQQIFNIEMTGTSDISR